MRVTNSVLGLAAAAVAALSACSVHTTDSSAPPVVVVDATGDLTVTWTVASSDAPAACAQYFADAAELTVYDSAGRLVADELAPCEDFTLTLELPVDTYEGNVMLVDVDDSAVSTTLPLDDLRITDGTELVVDVDFPPDSML